MKYEKEMHGQELGPKNYLEYFEVKSERPTFGERDKNSSGHTIAGHDREWSSATPQDKFPDVTPISGGKDGDIPKKRRHSTIDAYTGGRNYDPENGRVPDAGKTWEASAPTGSSKMYPNLGPQTAANKREVKIGWKERYAAALRPDSQVADAMTAPNTPQRKKLRRTESK
jgi:hypothetical protein